MLVRPQQVVQVGNALDDAQVLMRNATTNRDPEHVTLWIEFVQVFMLRSHHEERPASNRGEESGLTLEALIT